VSARPGAVAGAIVLLAAGCTIDARVATVNTDGGVKPDAVANTDVVVDAGSKQFETLPAGTPLPDDATCAARVRRAAGEPRPANATPNMHVPTAAEVAQVIPFDRAHQFDDKAQALRQRITGAFTGTTDEILQWAACKWGFDEDIVRAESVESSGWRQTVATDWTDPTSPDCPPGGAMRGSGSTAECAETYGLLQVRWKFNPSAWPMFRESSAFHVDYVFAKRRACFEGWDIGQSTRVSSGTYGPNDIWGCLGAHFSGQWYDDGANAYIGNVKSELAALAWTKPEFCSNTPGCVLPR
jgi:hypothetical protein